MILSDHQQIEVIIHIAHAYKVHYKSMASLYNPIRYSRGHILIYKAVNQRPGFIIFLG